MHAPMRRRRLIVAPTRERRFVSKTRAAKLFEVIVVMEEVDRALDEPTGDV